MENVLYRTFIFSINDTDDPAINAFLTSCADYEDGEDWRNIFEEIARLEYTGVYMDHIMSIYTPESL